MYYFRLTSTVRCMLAIWTGLLAVQVSGETKYGVGFHLSLDYVTAAIYFQNGTFVDLAKVEGNASYKQMMRDMQEPGLKERPTAYQADSYRSSEAIQGSLMPQSIRDIRDRLPPWLGGPQPHPYPLPLKGMLQVLKTSAESYLGESPSYATVTAPFPIRGALLNSCESAGSSISLKTFCRSTAGQVVTQERGLTRSCPDDDLVDDNLILTVEYSQAALTALLIGENCGLMVIERMLHDPSLGVRDLTGDSSSSRLKHALQQFVAFPMDSPAFGHEFDHVDSLVFFGDAADDSPLHEIVTDVLREGFEDRTINASYIGSLDPVFLAARGAAQENWLVSGWWEEDRTEL